MIGLLILVFAAQMGETDTSSVSPAALEAASRISPAQARQLAEIIEGAHAAARDALIELHRQSDDLVECQTERDEAVSESDRLRHQLSLPPVVTSSATPALVEVKVGIPWVTLVLGVAAGMVGGAAIAAGLGWKL